MDIEMKAIERRHKLELFDMIVEGVIVVRYLEGDKKPYFRLREERENEEANASDKS